MKSFNDMCNSELADELTAYMNGERDGDGDEAVDDFDRLVRVCIGRLRNSDKIKK